ncbi:hypothetical protein H1R20_g4987, partial [Candolleomyces eurysporus]
MQQPPQSPGGTSEATQDDSIIPPSGDDSEIEVVAHQKRKDRSNSLVQDPDGGAALSSDKDLPKKVVPSKSQHQATKRPRKSTLDTSVNRQTNEQEPDSPNLIFLVPQYISETSRRLTLAANTTFGEAQEEMYNLIGCQDVKVKPDLSYKLATATVKAKSIALNSDEDWVGLLEDINQGGNKQKKSPLPISIFVEEKYLASLRVYRGAASKTASAGSSKAKKGKVPLMDLDGGDEDDGGSGDPSIHEKESKALEQLDAVLNGCQKCGPGVSCKIAVDGSHVMLTFQQRQAWSIALAHGTSGVTLQTPPRSNQFRMFFKDLVKEEPVTASSAQASAPQGLGGGIDTTAMTTVAGTMAGMMMGMSNIFGGGPWMMPPPGHPPQAAPAFPPTPTPFKALKYDHLLSSPPTEPDSAAYPLISDFFQQLDQMDATGSRNLSQYLKTFLEEDFFYINELADYSEDKLVDVFKMSRGNARFFCQALAKEMKKVRREFRK